MHGPGPGLREPVPHTGTEVISLKDKLMRRFGDNARVTRTDCCCHSDGRSGHEQRTNVMRVESPTKGQTTASEFLSLVHEQPQQSARLVRQHRVAHHGSAGERR